MIEAKGRLFFAESTKFVDFITRHLPLVMHGSLCSNMELTNSEFQNKSQHARSLVLHYLIDSLFGFTVPNHG